MNGKFVNALPTAGLPPGPGTPGPVTEADLATLPGTARRYLGWAGVVGRPRDWSFRMTTRFGGLIPPPTRNPGVSWR